MAGVSGKRWFCLRRFSRLKGSSTVLLTALSCVLCSAHTRAPHQQHHTLHVSPRSRRWGNRESPQPLPFFSLLLARVYRGGFWCFMNNWEPSTAGSLLRGLGTVTEPRSSSDAAVRPFLALGAASCAAPTRARARFPRSTSARVLLVFEQPCCCNAARPRSSCLTLRKHSVGCRV